MDAELLKAVKLALRIEEANELYDPEIKDLIASALDDLKLVGVREETLLPDDHLVRMAVVTYCKAHFGFDNPDAERLLQSFEMLKERLSLAEGYGYVIQQPDQPD